MKRYKRMFAMLALAWVVAAAAAPLEAQAQRGARGFGMDVDAQVTALTELLELDEEQATKVREILAAQAESRRERFQGMTRGSMDRGAIMELMRKLQEETETELAEVLSEEQMEKYREFVAQQRQRRGPPRSERRSGGYLEAGARTVAGLGPPFGARPRCTSTTAATMTAVPTSIGGVNASAASHHPRNSATTGLT